MFSALAVVNRNFAHGFSWTVMNVPERHCTDPRASICTRFSPDEQSAALHLAISLPKSLSAPTLAQSRCKNRIEVPPLLLRDNRTLNSGC